MVKTPLLDVVRVVISEGGKILLVQEFDDENWKLPGGKIHEGETIYQALVREVKEELGLAITEDMIIKHLSTNIPHSENIRHIFLVRGIKAKDIQETEEVVEARFFTLEELPPTKFKEHITSAVEMTTQ